MDITRDQTRYQAMANPESIGQLFHACDLDGSGYIDEAELSAICSDLSRDEIGNVFRELDADGDGKISIAEFQEGFKGIQENLLNASRGSPPPAKPVKRLEAVRHMILYPFIFVSFTIKIKN